MNLSYDLKIATTLKNNYLCKKDFCNLYMSFDPADRDKYLVRCVVHGDETPGYIKAATVATIRTNNKVQLAKMWANYPAAFGVADGKPDIEELINSISPDPKERG